jgi:hypothetical protein
VLALTAEESGMPAEVSALGEARVQARLAKEWRKSDELRDQLAALGWEARDTKDGQKITRRGGASSTDSRCFRRTNFSPSVTRRIRSCFENQTYVWDALKQIAAICSFD